MRTEGHSSPGAVLSVGGLDDPVSLRERTHLAQLETEAAPPAQTSAAQFLDADGPAFETMPRIAPGARPPAPAGMRAADFLDAPDAAPRSAAAFLDTPEEPGGLLARAVNALRSSAEQIRGRSEKQWTDAGFPSAEELEQASRPARMTLTRGGQPVLAANAPAPQSNADEPQGPTSMQRAAIAAEPYLEPMIKTARAMGDPVAVGETAANLATGSVAMPIAGIAGLAAAGAKAAGADVDPVKVVEWIQEHLTYQPHTELGQHLTGSTLWPLEKLTELSKFLGGKTLDATGSPAVAAAVETAIVNAPFALPLAKGLRSARAARTERGPAVEAAPLPGGAERAAPPAGGPSPSIAPADAATATQERAAATGPATTEAPAPGAPGERRADPGRRAMVDEMTPEEMRRELLTSPFGGIGNRRAYEESAKHPVQIALDLDSLKYINDQFGHAAGDELLSAVAQSLAKVAPEKSYHLSGDEFAMQAADHAESDRMLAALGDELSGYDITYHAPDGRVFNYSPRVTHGKGSTLAEADIDLSRAKLEREQAGERAPRGERPRGMAEAPAGGREAPDQAAPEVVGAELQARGSRELPAEAIDAADVRAADRHVEPEPSAAQKDAENFRMGHLRWKGLDISIETPKGGTRTAKDGSWSVPDFPASYGRIKGTRGADGEHVDAFIGDHVDSPRVYVIDQVDPKSGRFDEHKLFLGFRSRDEAVAAYDAAFSDGSGPERRGAVSETSPGELKLWLQRGKTTKPFSPPLSGAAEQEPTVRSVLARMGDVLDRGAKSLERLSAEMSGRAAAEPQVRPRDSRGPAEPTLGDQHGRAGEAVDMAPGSAYAGFIDDSKAAPAPAASRGEPIRREDVLAPFLKALNVPIYEGRIAGGARMGYFKPKLETVRIKRASDLETAAHELAHLIDDRVFNGFGSDKTKPRARPWITGPHARTFADELRGVSYDATKVYEGWAEYVRLWMTQPEKAKAAAPQFTKWFETFIESHQYGEAIKGARERMQAWYGQDALARARSKIGEKRDINAHLDSFWDRFRQATADDLHGVYRMERELAGEVMPRGAYETTRLTRAAHSMVDGMLRLGHLERKPDGSYRFAGKGLEQILKPVTSRLDDFLLYAVGRSARELRAQGREHLFTPGEIKAMLELERPEFDTAFKEYQRWNRGVLDFAEAHGVINAEARQQWRRAEYLPFHRVGTGEPQRRVGGAEGNWSGIKKLTGGTENIRDVLGNMIGNAAMLVDVALKNEARAKIVQLARERTGGGRFLEEIPPESRKVKIDKDQLREKLLEAAGLSERDRAPGQAEVARTIDDILDGAPYLMDFLVHGQAPTGGKIMAVLRNGKPSYYEVVDPILYRAVAALNRPAQIQIVRWLGLPKRIGQASITLTMDFAAANIARDTIMGAVMSRSGFRPAIDSLKGLASRLTKDPAYAEYIANGGGYASYFVDEGAFKAHLARFYSSKGINPRTVIDAPSKLLHFVETLFDSFELSTRLGEYKRLRAQGENPRRAAYMAREVSTDFGMKGDSQILGFFYDTVMFLRPAVVSLDRIFRGVAHDPNRGAIAAKAAALALMSAALYLHNRGNPDYEDLEDWDRDNYWHFFIPKPGGGHLHFRYPKIWEIGALATLAERSVQRTMDSQPKEYAQDFARVIGQTFHVNVMPQALAPLYEQATNREDFTGRPIEPRGLEDLQPYLRATPGTSETMRRLGLASKGMPEALQVNPVRAEALLKGYLNTWALYGLLLSDSAFFGDKMPERRLDEYPVLRRFFRQDPPLHVKDERTFYELLEETRRLKATMRELDRRGEDYDVGEQEADVLGRSTYLNRVQRDLRESRREVERVRSSEASPAEKRRQLDELTAGRNAMLREAVGEVAPERAARRPPAGSPSAKDIGDARLRAIRNGIPFDARP